MTKQISKYRGFSLIEIMVVVAIMGLLAAIVGTNVIGAYYNAKVRKVHADFSNIESALKMYRLENGFYPSSDQGLLALVNKPSGHPQPRSFPKDGYLTRLPKDPWRNEYIYIMPGDNHPYELLSFGADAQEGGEDEDTDLSVWDNEE